MIGREVERATNSSYGTIWSVEIDIDIDLDLDNDNDNDNDNAKNINGRLESGPVSSPLG